MHIMDLNWDDLKTILHVVRAGTLTGAASTLGINYTTIARRIARAEGKLDARLFERLSDGYHPTDIGRAAADHAELMEAQEDALLRKIRGQDQSLKGPLVVTAPQLLIKHHLVHVIDVFCTVHPKVELHVNAANDVLDLTRRQADLAVRISNRPGDDLTGLRLTAQDVGIFANRDVAARIAQAPDAPVNWVLYSQAKGIPKAALERFPNSRVRARFDDMVSMAGAAQAGLGVVRMPLFLGRAMPDLVQIPTIPAQAYADIWVVAHSDVWPSAKVTAFRKFLAEYFRKNRAVFVT